MEPGSSYAIPSENEGYNYGKTTVYQRERTIRGYSALVFLSKNFAGFVEFRSDEQSAYLH